MADLWTADAQPARQPKLPSPQQRKDLATLRLDPERLPRHRGVLSAAITRAWPELQRPGNSSWGPEQVSAFQRLRAALPQEPLDRQQSDALWRNRRRWSDG